MSTSGYQPGNLPSPQGYDATTMNSVRRDSPVTNRNEFSPGGSESSSSNYPGYYQTPIYSKEATQASPPHQKITPGVQSGFHNGPVNGISGQMPLSSGQNSMLPGAQSRSASSSPHLSAGLGQPLRPGSVPLPGTSPEGPSPLYQPPTTTLADPSSGVTYNPGGTQHLSSLSGPSLPSPNLPGPATNFTTNNVPQIYPTGGSPTSYSRPSSGMPGPDTSRLPASPVRPSPWQQASLSGRQPGMGLASSPSQPSGLAPPPPTGQMIDSTGQQLVPKMSQPPAVGPAVPPTSASAAQVSSAPMSKRRVYPTQAQARGSYPSAGYSSATMAQPPPATPMTSGTPGGMPAPGQGLMPNMNRNTSQGSSYSQYASNQQNELANQMGKLSVQPSVSQPINLLERRYLAPLDKEPIALQPPDLQKKNARRSLLCCTLNSVPENYSLLQKCKLPFGILVHPFKDLSSLPVIHSTTIVRCRSCRTYINPFVTFTESRRWRCNMCYRINEVPDEFCFDPQTKSYGEPTRRPEIKSATYEFIAPSEYMLRAPQPASYVFAFDVSFNAMETGYLKLACETVKENLDKIPGDSRALVGFLTFNKSVNFYNLSNDQSQPHMLIVSDIDDIFLPAPEDLLVNLRENKEMIIQFLDSLPETFASTGDIHSATGAAMQAALKLLTATGGRITVFQTTLPSIGPGSLENRDEPGVKSSAKDGPKLNPATDFYKKLALDCAAVQVSVDVFLLSAQYADGASLTVTLQEKSDLRLLCELGVPKISIEESLTDTDMACFQSALLYTSSRGERRIRVHNLALPVTKKMSDVYAGADANAIALMLSKMAVDRTLSASLGDAREALMNAIVDCLGVYKSAVSGHSGQLLAPNSLRLLPLYILSLLKQTAFRLGCLASLDSRCYAMQQFKVMPFSVALLTIYPALYSLHDMTDEGAIMTKSGSVPQPPRLLLSGEKLSRIGIFLMDAGQEFYIWVGKETAEADIQCLFGLANFASIPEDMGGLPELDNSLSIRVRAFLDYLQSNRTNHANLFILRDNSRMRMKFIDKLMNDRTESKMSYHEFLIHLQGQVN